VDVVEKKGGARFKMVGLLKIWRFERWSEKGWPNGGTESIGGPENYNKNKNTLQELGDQGEDANEGGLFNRA